MAEYRRQKNLEVEGPESISPRPPESVKKFSSMETTASDRATLLSGSPRKERPNNFVMKNAGMASLNSILLGYDIGVMGGAMVLIQRKFDLSDFQFEIGLSILNVMAIFGAALSNFTSDKFGRTKTLFTASLLFLTGNILMALAVNFNMLLFGRILCGFGVGTGLAIDPLYISEISPARYRGGLVSLSEMSINVGITLGFIFDWIYSYLDHDYAWRLMLGMGVIPSVLMLYLSSCVMSETPRWLMMQKRKEEADAVLSKMTRSPQEAGKVKSEINEAIRADEIAIGTSWSAIFRPTPVVRRMLIVVFGVAISQQLSGIETVMYYTPVILTRAGIKSLRQALGVQALMGIFKTLVIVLSAWLLDRPGSTGRRPLLLISLPGCACSLLILGLAFQQFEGQPDDVESDPSLAIFGIFSYAFFFSIGIGPVCWLFCAEILPLHIRAKGMSFATSLNRITSAVTSVTFLDLTREVGDAGAFYLYFVITMCCAVFAWWFVPETKGKTLEEMVKYFEEITGSRSGHMFLSDRNEPPGSPNGGGRTGSDEKRLRTSDRVDGENSEEDEPEIPASGDYSAVPIR